MDISEKELREYAKEICKWDLKPTVMICTVCGQAFKVNDRKNYPPCEHLKQLAKDLLEHS